MRHLKDWSSFWQNDNSVCVCVSVCVCECVCVCTCVSVSDNPSDESCVCVCVYVCVCTCVDLQSGDACVRIIVVVVVVVKHTDTLTHCFACSALPGPLCVYCASLIQHIQHRPTLCILCECAFSIVSFSTVSFS